MESATPHFPNAKMKLFPLILACVLASATLRAQETLVTLGATTTVGGQPHAYILWQPQASEDSLFKSFGIYSKPGDAQSAGVFVREGIQTLQASPRTIRAMLELGSKLDLDPLGAARRIDGMFRDLTLRHGQAPGAPGNLDASEKLAYIIQAAATDTRLLTQLFFLGRAHAGVMLALGHAFTHPMPAGVRTYEIRELDQNDADVRVLGRVTLNPLAPVQIPPPDRPVVVSHLPQEGSPHPASSKDHLNVRLRWNSPANLRSTFAHSFGFDVYRVKKAVAESLGWHLQRPLAADVLNLLAAMNPASPDPDIARANELPVLVTRLLDFAEANDLNDDQTVYLADDGVRHDAPDGRRVLRPYVDGESFYYFAAARDITGRPGIVSTGRLVTICDRLPPLPPRIESVLSTFDAPAGGAVEQSGGQFLRVQFRQLPENQPEGATKYFVYRWSTPQEVLQYTGDVGFNRVGALNHTPGAKFAVFDDKGGGAPTLETHQDQTVWYTVRAVGRTACGDEKTLSAHSAPVPGVLRDFKAPDAPEGVVTVTQNTPVLVPGNPIFREDKAGDNAALEQALQARGLDPGFRGLAVDVTRQSAEIASVHLAVEVQQADNSFLPVHSAITSFQSGDVLRAHLPFRLAGNRRIRVKARAITQNGVVSNLADAELSRPANITLVGLVIVGFEASVNRRDLAFGGAVDTHEAVNADGSVNPVRGTVVYAPDNIREWRIYRRVHPDGGLALIQKSEGEPLESAAVAERKIAPGLWVDVAMPSTPGATVCYYAQIFDQNANPSPLTLLGCVRLAGAPLPTPMLTEVREVEFNADNRPEFELEWFCDPVGVERFEVLIGQEGGGAPQVTGVTPVQLDPVAFTPVDLETGNPNAGFQTLPGRPDLRAHGFQTSRAGTAGVGGGPRFTAKLTVTDPLPRTLVIAVRAVGAGQAPRQSGAASNTVSVATDFTIGSIGGDPEGVIPWPARSLPPVIGGLREESYGTREGPYLAIPTGTEGPADAATLILAGEVPAGLFISTNATTGTPTDISRNAGAPESLFWQHRRVREDAGATEPLMPCIIYRHQLPSAAFPNARANLVQCTPLLDRLSWQDVSSTVRRIRDPFICIFERTAVIGNSKVAQLPDKTPYLDDASAVVFIKDPLPVIAGARYQHLIVRFDGTGEISRVIACPPVQH